MIRTTATGHANNQFVDNDPTAQPPVPGTIVDALWLNNTQEELCKIIEDAGLSLDQSGATKEQLRQALDILYALKNGDNTKTFDVASPTTDDNAVNLSHLNSEFNIKNPIGEIRSFLFYRPAGANFPYYFLGKSAANLDRANYPDAIDVLRAEKFYYHPGLPAEQSQFEFHWIVITNNVCTLTMVNYTAEMAMLAVFEEDLSIRGSANDWRTITFPATTGPIPAGTYKLTNVDAAAYSMSFEITAADYSSSVTGFVEYYPFRVEDSVTGASDKIRMLQIGGHVLQAINDLDDYIQMSFLRNDTMQGHRHNMNDAGYLVPGVRKSTVVGPGGHHVADGTVSNAISDYIYVHDPSPTGSHGTPRVDHYTDPRSLGTLFYMYMGKYVP